jgi:hypothetical protein
MPVAARYGSWIPETRLDCGRPIDLRDLQPGKASRFVSALEPPANGACAQPDPCRSRPSSGCSTISSSKRCRRTTLRCACKPRSSGRVARIPWPGGGVSGAWESDGVVHPLLADRWIPEIWRHQEALQELGDRNQRYFAVDRIPDQDWNELWANPFSPSRWGVTH